jgi:hypothetical protein
VCFFGDFFAQTAQTKKVARSPEAGGSLAFGNDDGEEPDQNGFPLSRE